MSSLRTSCAKLVRAQWAYGGSIVHRLSMRLWIRRTIRKLSPGLSTVSSALSTQIVHRPVDAVTRVKRRFSSQSTAITITTTIYI